MGWVAGPGGDRERATAARPRPTEAGGARWQPRARWCVWRCPRPRCCWAGARPSGRTSRHRRCPGSQGWSGDSWRTLADEAPRHAQPRDDEWWRQFDDPVLDQLVAEAQRLNPGVRTAGLRILESRAQLGIAGSALYPQLQQVSADAPGCGQPTAATATAAPSGSFGAGLRPRPGSWTSGASSSAASSRPMPPTSRASRSTTTSRCWSRRRRRASTRRSAPPSCGCASRTRTPRCSSAASRSPSACSAAATMPSSTCSRPARTT